MHLHTHLALDAFSRRIEFDNKKLSEKQQRQMAGEGRLEERKKEVEALSKETRERESDLCAREAALTREKTAVHHLHSRMEGKIEEHRYIGVRMNVCIYMYM